jgi:hypothetical protein
VRETGAEDGEERRYTERYLSAYIVAESALAAGLDRGSRDDRYQVVVHVDAEVLAAGDEGIGAVRPGSRTVPTFPRERPTGWSATRSGW